MIGIIELPKHPFIQSKIHNYVKWVESSGAKVRIIPYDVSLSELTSILSTITGIVFTGGSINDNQKYTHEQRMTYVTTLYHAYTQIKKYNDQGRYFPIWGTCLGFEMLMLFQQNRPLENIFVFLQHHKLKGISTIKMRDSRIKSFFPDWILPEMETRPCAIHSHTFGFDIVPDKNVTIVSTESDFINMIEFKQYPFYGTQFHPEKYTDLFSKQISILFSCFFYRECKKNSM